jgi:hypothetical protein
VNADGIPVYFGSSDVKALLTYWVANYDEAVSSSSIVGRRCAYDIADDPRLAETPECSDINPGSFDVLVSNLIGNKGRAISKQNKKNFFLPP